MLKCKKFISFILIFFICFGLTGCYDSAEIDDYVYALAIGIDKGTNNKLRVTIEYPTYMGGGGTGGQSGGGGGAMGGTTSKNQLPGAIVHTVEASSLMEAFDIFNTAISRKVSLTHTSMLVISEAFAKDGIGDYIAPIERYRETRGNMVVVISKTNAEDIIRDLKPNIGESLSKEIELMTNQSYNTGYFPNSTFFDFYKSILSPYDEAYAIYAGINDFSALGEPNPKESKSPLKIEQGLTPGNEPRSGVAKREFVGTAVFRGDKMVGTLDSNETRYFEMVNGKFDKGIFTIPDEKSKNAVIPISLRFGRKPVINVKFIGDKPVINISLNVEGDLDAVQSRYDYEKVDNIGIIDKELEKIIKNGIEDTITKVQKDYRSDIFCFGTHAAKYFPTIQDFERYNWFKHFPDAKVNVSVKANIRDTGLMIESSPIMEKNGE